MNYTTSASLFLFEYKNVIERKLLTCDNI